MLNRESTPYLFLGQTTSLCGYCLELVPAKILEQQGDIYFLKRCPDHGAQKVRVSSDADYYKSTTSYLKPGDQPFVRHTQHDKGCPYDCGLCPDHEQHSCLALIEVTDACNLSCPVCFADSSPSRQTFRSLDTIENMLDLLVESELEPDLVQFSGGEPTIHPQILEILKAAKERPIRHIMLNTNGLRIAKDKAFVAELAKLAPGFEVYLQFDSFEREALMALRGADLRDIRHQALKNLEEVGLSTTLVSVLVRGLNDHEVGRTIDFATEFDCVRGVAFQPVQDAGRCDGYNAESDRLYLTDVRRSIAESDNPFTLEDVIPLPCNPPSIAIAYGLRNGRKITPITSLIPKDSLIAAAPNSVTFEKYPAIRAEIEKLMSLSNAGEAAAKALHDFLCCLPQIEAPASLDYGNVFRVTIIEFMDRHNFCLSNIKRSCIHFVTDDGRIIPFETYNLFHRPGVRRPHETQPTHNSVGGSDE